MAEKNYQSKDPRQQANRSTASPVPPAPASKETLPARMSTAADVKTLLERFKGKIAEVLPKHVGVDRLVRTTMLCITQNPKLLQCDSKSFLRSVMQSASLGLELGTVLQLAYLVPFWNSSRNCLECQFIPGYRGLIDLARRSGQVADVYARIVYEKEKCEIEEGTLHGIKHTPLPPSKRGEKRVGAYAVARGREGRVLGWEWMWAEEIEAIRKKSLDQKKNPKDNPWNTHEEEMWKKSPVRRLAKWLPLSPEFQRAASIDEYQEEGITPPFDPEIDAALQDIPEPGSTDVSGKTAAKTEELKGRLKQNMASENVGADALAGSLPSAVSNPADLASPPGEDIPDFPFHPPAEPPLPSEPSHTVPAPQPATQAPPSALPPSGGGLPLFPPAPKAPPPKAEDFWLPDRSKVKCPPGGLNEGYLVVPQSCKNKCYMIKSCPAWKEDRI